MRIRLLATVALVLTALACGKKKEAEPTQGTKAGQEDKAQAGARTGGHVRLPSNEPLFLNPVIEKRFNRAVPLLFDGLVALGPSLEPVPALAASWDIAPDGKTITFRLRKDASWHDGKPFTAKDVAYTFEAMRKTEARSVWKGYFAEVEGLETPDDHTVIVKYRRAYAPALTTWTMGILPAHVFGDADLKDAAANREPVGTGPYKLSRWEEGKRMILAANESYFRGRPKLDTVELLFEVRDPITALTEGQVDFAEISSEGDWRAQTSGTQFRERFESTDIVEAKIRIIAWNTQKKPFDDKRVRQALTLALNRDRVIDTVLQGQAQALSAPFFPTMFGVDRSIAPHPFDLDRAVKLLDEAGYPSKDGQRFDIELIVIDSLRGPTSDEMLAIFRRDLGAIGIDLKVSFVPASEFFERTVLRDFDAAYFGWLPEIPDPDPYSLLHSSQISGGSNFAGFANAEADRLLESARNTLSRDERRTLYQKLHALLHQELPYSPLYAPFGHYAWSRDLGGVDPADVGPQPRVPGLAGWWRTGTR